MELDLFTLVSFSLLGAISWLLSTLGGGGASLTFVGISSLFLSPHTVVAGSAITSGIASLYRIGSLNNAIIWNILFRSLIGLLIGVPIGGWLYNIIDDSTLRVLVIILFATHLFFQYLPKDKDKNEGKQLPLKGKVLWLFAVASCLKGIVSTLLGGAGPLVNPLYIRFGILGKNLSATKAFLGIIKDILKWSMYLSLGYATGQALLFGLASGIGAVFGCFLGHKCIDRLPQRTLLHSANVLILIYLIINTVMLFKV